MAEWYEIPEEELDAGAKASKEADFANTFYSTAAGRHVLLELMKLCYEIDTPVASMAKIGLFNKIRSNCGVDLAVEMCAINAEATLILAKG